jgi:hypothetical protein
MTFLSYSCERAALPAFFPPETAELRLKRSAPAIPCREAPIACRQRANALGAWTKFVLAFSAVMEPFLARHRGGTVEPVGDALSLAASTCPIGTITYGISLDSFRAHNIGAATVNR